MTIFLVLGHALAESEQKYVPVIEVSSRFVALAEYEARDSD